MKTGRWPASNFENAKPASDQETDVKAAARYDAIYNRWFLEGVFNKAYPQEAPDGLAPHMPAGFEKDFETIGERPDWIGVNYYTRKIVGDNPTEPLPMAPR